MREREKERERERKRERERERDIIDHAVSKDVKIGCMEWNASGKATEWKILFCSKCAPHALSGTNKSSSFMFCI